jgi:GAF domain-containing protein
VLSLIEGDDYLSLLQRVVTTAHHHLGLDAVYISELAPDVEVYRAVAGDAAGFGVEVGGSAARETALCELVVTGRVPALIRDTRRGASTSLLPATTVAGVGAYIGVPLVYSDGSVHGMICGLGRSPDESLDDRDVRFMAMLAERPAG